MRIRRKFKLCFTANNDASRGFWRVQFKSLICFRLPPSARNNSTACISCLVTMMATLPRTALSRQKRWPQVGEITVVAPERDRSGASNSLTLDRPLKLGKSSDGFYHINGTPTDCVHMAVTDC